MSFCAEAQKHIFCLAEFAENCYFCAEAQKLIFSLAESVESCNFCAEAQKLIFGLAESVEKLLFLRRSSKILLVRQNLLKIEIFARGRRVNMKKIVKIAIFQAEVKKE